MAETNTRKQSPLKKLRTFADDVKRANPDGTVEQEVITSTKNQPIPKAKAVKALPKVIPTPSEPKPIIKPKPAAIPQAIPKKNPTHPPAFHTLTAHNTITKPIPAKAPKVRDEGNDYSETTIIRDTVKRRTNVFAAMGTALLDSGRNFRKFWKRANQPLYVVPETNRRKGVIQEATSQTGKTFTSDYEQLKERLRLRAAVPEPSDEADIIWTPQTEPGFPLLTGAVQPVEDSGFANAVSNVVFEPKRSITTQKPVQLDTASEVVKPQIITRQAPEATNQARPPAVAPTPQAPNIPSPPPVPTITQAVSPIAPVKTPSPALPIKPAVSPLTTAPPPAPTSVTFPPAVPERQLPATPEVTVPNYESSTDPEFTAEPPVDASRKDNSNTRWSINQLSTNAMALGITGLLVVVTLLGFGVTTLIRTLSSDTTDTTLATAQPTSLTTANLVSVPYNILDPASLADTILTTLQSSPTAGELVVVDQAGAPWQPEQVFAALNLSVGTGFQAAVETVRFVRTGPERYGLVFTFSNPTHVQGNLLTWEPALGRELTFLFGTTGAVTFTDQTQAGIDLRVAGTSITYGLIDGRIGIIAKEPEHFTTIRELLITN
jgi:hypothetical protein